MELVIKGVQRLSLPFLFGCGHLCLLPSQIAGFINHQYLWKEWIDVLDFLHRVEKKDEYPSRNISEIMDCERGGYLNV